MSMKRVQSLLAALLGALALAAMPSAHAQNTIKVGVIAAFSGPFADYGGQIEAGMKAYMKEHGDTVAGKKVELITRDTKGPAPEVAKRLAQELITRDKVQFLAGFGLTPNAMAVAPVVTEAKVPMIISNAATSSITTKSPYITRVSMTIPQIAEPLAQWALKNGIKQVYTVVADYGPGIDAETQFTKTFKAGGGQIVGSVRTPLQNPDFSAAVQRVKDAKPHAVFVFLPAGEQGVAFVKGFNERGLGEAGIKMIATGDITDDHVLAAMGDPTLGMITAFHYSAAHDSPENAAFLKSYAAANDAKVGAPNFMAAAGYDTMHVIYEVSKKLNGNIGGDQAMAAIKGMKWMSPRGPVEIDPATRDIDQTVYIRKVEKVNGKLANVEFDKIPNVKDPGK
ncbi:MAG TPA: ABC transporter substrate-binding protein [Casimicrobiaceae bacterium]|nr:ABC transporter substrate-binding protein [Casimicrobiaceae bacterium]